MSGLKIDPRLLSEFEEGLNPRFPERSVIPARVLGYGEISTVLEIGTGAARELAYKRLPMFGSEEEAERYEALYAEYVQVLQERIGIRVVPSETIRLTGRGRVIVYIVQEKFPPEAFGHKAIHRLPLDDVERLVLAALGETKKVFDFNSDELAIGFDGQISNWAILGFDPEAPELGEDVELVYFDTSSPLLRKHSQEQLDPELFLRSAPSFLVWIIRLLFLEDVMTRYYDFRHVVVDLIANFYKEQRPDLIPGLVDTVNRFFATEVREGRFEPITVKEVRDYYREDAWIWRVYLAFRKMDRTLHT
ncbi:MAG TPA: hypothetical protein EYH32_07145, partial [Anaerolineae bacterium]|nr:hypothetical protein [Anaerolineae bacterium]